MFCLQLSQESSSCLPRLVHARPRLHSFHFTGCACACSFAYACTLIPLESVKPNVELECMQTRWAPTASCRKQQQRIKIATTLMKTPLRSRATASSSSSGGGSRPLARTPRRKPIRYKLKPRTLEIPLPTPRRQASAAASSDKAGKKTPKKTAR